MMGRIPLPAGFKPGSTVCQHSIKCATKAHYVMIGINGLTCSTK